MDLSARKFQEWKADAPPNRKYNFLLDGKPYRGPYNKRYVGSQVLYYTGVNPTRYSKQLEYKPKGFTISSEPVIGMMERWLMKDPIKKAKNLLTQRHEDLIIEQPLYGSIVGAKGISDEAVRRPEIGFKIIKQNPYTGKTSVLETTVDKRLKELRKEQTKARRGDLKEQAKFSNPLLQSRDERRRVRVKDRFQKAEKDFEQEEIEAATPAPTPVPVYNPSIRQTLLAGERATDYLTDNKNFVTEFIDTIADRSEENIIEQVVTHFKVNQTRAKRFIKDNPEVFNRNKK